MCPASASRTHKDSRPHFAWRCWRHCRLLSVHPTRSQLVGDRRQNSARHDRHHANCAAKSSHTALEPSGSTICKNGVLRSGVAELDVGWRVPLGGLGCVQCVYGVPGCVGDVYWGIQRYEQRSHLWPRSTTTSRSERTYAKTVHHTDAHRSERPLSATALPCPISMQKPTRLWINCGFRFRPESQ